MKDNDKQVLQDVADPFAVETEISGPQETDDAIDSKTGERVPVDPDSITQHRGQKKLIETEVPIDGGDIVDDEPSEDLEEPPAPSEEPDEEPTPEELEVAKKERQRKSESEKRIRELVSKNKEKDSELLEAKKLVEAQKQNLVLLGKTIAESRLAEAQNELKNAMAANDAEKIPDLVAKVATEAEAVRKFAAVAKELSEGRPAQDRPKEQEAAPSTQSESQKLWLEGKESWLFTENYQTLDRDLRRAVLPYRDQVRKFYNDLVQEGFSEDSAAFYDELDMRMADKYPDTYDALVAEGPSVLLSISDKKSSSGAQTLNPSAKKGQEPSAVQKKPSAVASRAPGSRNNSAPTTKPAKQSISFENLSKEEKLVYNYNYAGQLSKEEYVRRLMRLKAEQ